MPKISVLRKGAGRPVMIDAKIANALVKHGTFTYADDTTLPKPKPKAKADDAARSAKTEAPKAAEEKTVKEEKIQKPEGVRSDATTTEVRSVAEPMSMSRFELAKLTNAQLRAIGEKEGVKFDANETKADLIAKIVKQRYARRDMRAED